MCWKKTQQWKILQKIELIFSKKQSRRLLCVMRTSQWKAWNVKPLLQLLNNHLIDWTLRLKRIQEKHLKKSKTRFRSRISLLKLPRYIWSYCEMDFLHGKSTKMITIVLQIRKIFGTSFRIKQLQE